MKGWAYSRGLAEELGQRPLLTQEKLWAEIIGLGLGQMYHDDGFAWTLTSPLAARRAYRIVKALELSAGMELKREGRRIGYRLTVHGPIRTPDRQAELPPGDLLRGCFLTHGYMNSPERGLHLEFRVTVADAPMIASALRRIRVKAGMMPHHGGVTVYVKGQEGILRVLGEMGAHRALLQLESLRVVRAVKNQVNRLVNSETANLVRTVESGVEQARDLARMAASPTWQRLPDRLRVVAEARLRHPDWSLKELGQSLDPVLTKSAVNYRMRRLLAICRQQSEGAGAPAP